MNSKKSQQIVVKSRSANWTDAEIETLVNEYVNRKSILEGSVSIILFN